MSEAFVSPSLASPAQRAAANAALQDRIGSVMGRVAADGSQSRRVRAANTRDAKSAHAMAAALRKTGHYLPKES